MKQYQKGKLLFKIFSQLLIIFLCQIAIGQNIDIEGKWEGTILREGVKYSIEATFLKDSFNTKYQSTVYKGISRIKGGGLVNTGYGLPSKGKAQVFFQASSTANHIFYGECLLLNSNRDQWCMNNAGLTYARDGNTETISGTTNNGQCNIANITLTKVKNDLSSRDRDDINEVKSKLENGIKISNFVYISEEGNNVIKPNQTGSISCKLTNNTPYIINNEQLWIDFGQYSELVRFVFNSNNEERGIASRTVSLKPNESVNVQFQTKTSLNSPTETVIANAYLQNFYSLKSEVKIVAKGFFNTKTFNQPAANNRIKAVESFFKDFGNTKASVALDQLAMQRDKKAIMWQSIFIYNGHFGFGQNEDVAIGRAKKARVFQPILDEAKNGDLEAIYLLAYAYSMGLYSEKIDPEYLLKVASDNGFIPAMYDVAQRQFKKRDFNAAFNAFKKVYAAGYKKAGFEIGYCFEKGLGVNSNRDSALSYFQNLAILGNTESILKLAELNIEGRLIKKDANAAVSILLKASNAGDNNARVYLANYYLKYTDTGFSRAVALLEAAAKTTHRKAMFELGLLYLNNKNTANTANQTEAVQWIKSAAEAGEAEAMHLLGNLYISGNGLEKSNTKARFWLAQAKVRGVGVGNQDRLYYGNPFGVFMDGILDYKPSLYETVTNQYGNVIREGYIDNTPLDYFIGGLGAIFQESQRQKQEIINDLQLIKEVNGHKVYGGVLTSRINLPHIKAHQLLSISVYGKVGLGLIAGTVGSKGTSDQMLTGFSIDPEINHGAVIANLNNSRWLLLGDGFQNAEMPADVDITIAVNDRQYQNNTGYFDIRIDIID